jgi:4-aminobutyrate aminotransferase
MEITSEQREIELAEYAREQRVVAEVEQLRFFPLVVSGGSGSTLITPSGRELLDFSASWTASGFGHANPHIAQSVHRALLEGAGCSVLSSAVAETTRLAERLVKAVPVARPERAYLGLGGTDANTAAITAAQKATGRTRIVSFSGSYHGGNGPSQDASGMALEDRSTETVDVVNYPVTQEQLKHTRERITEILIKRETACVIAEAIQCDGGVNVPPDDFLRMLREECTRTGTLLIIDEVKAGLGRTGERFAFEHSGIKPDLVTLGKALGGGLPCSAVVGPADVLSVDSASSLLTLAGSPVSAAAAHAVLDLLEDRSLLEHTVACAETIRGAFESYRASDRPGAKSVSQVRGKGLLFGVELQTPTGATVSGADLAALTVFRAWELGCVLYVVRDNVLELTPPYVMSQDELATGLSIVMQAVDDAVSGLVSRDVLDEFGGW